MKPNNPMDQTPPREADRCLTYYMSVFTNCCILIMYILYSLLIHMLLANPHPVLSL
jgi:hypothetical protein